VPPITSRLCSSGRQRKISSAAVVSNVSPSVPETDADAYVDNEKRKKKKTQKKTKKKKKKKKFGKPPKVKR
jgi:hypothetical protein